MRTLHQRTVIVSAILYARVSTSEQTIEHQLTQAEKALSIKFDTVISDDGVSGVTVKLKDRPQGKRLFDILRAGDILVVRWVDRLGRNYIDVTESIREFIQRGVVIKTVINGMVFDGITTDPMQMAVRDAYIGFMAALAQAQSEATKEAQKAGIAYAKTIVGTFKGRKPSYNREQLQAVLEQTKNAESVQLIARNTGLSRATVYRIQDNPAKAVAALALWN